MGRAARRTETLCLDASLPKPGLFVRYGLADGVYRRLDFLGLKRRRTKSTGYLSAIAMLIDRDRDVKLLLERAASGKVKRTLHQPRGTLRQSPPKANFQLVPRLYPMSITDPRVGSALGTLKETRRAEPSAE